MLSRSNVSLSVSDHAEVVLDVLVLGPILETIGGEQDFPRRPPRPFDPEEREQVKLHVVNPAPTLRFARRQQDLIRQSLPFVPVLRKIRDLDVFELFPEQLRQPPVVFDDAVGRASFISKPAGFSYVAQQCRKACLAREAVRVGRTWLSTLEVRDGLGPQRVAPRACLRQSPDSHQIQYHRAEQRGLVY